MEQIEGGDSLQELQGSGWLVNQRRGNIAQGICQGIGTGKLIETNVKMTSMISVEATVELLPLRGGDLTRPPTTCGIDPAD